ncbi:OB-fold domain-containing protein [Conexibacter sp. SYSU D00693]|uniref:OB-fold domain-containing protein n=1 Tax=Conexibacter sp. SYSU D00693 TaxID=2812560 RepID=UPI00196ADAE0|nr:OB-fold domain-containing protein [Conexibacter sp. SYSU D00693]
MPGIVSYGTYVPRHRLDRAAIRRTLNPSDPPGGRGTRAVAGFDEDTTSMGVEAARAARWNGSFTPTAVHFATTAPAYADKTNATAIHAALTLAPDVFATDHVGSIRSAVGALRAAAAEGGLAVLSDVRIGRPGSADEAGGGDGAAAFLFGEGDGVVAELVGQASATAEFLDRWRVPGEQHSSVWEERFGLGVYLPLVQDAAGRALAAAGVERPDHVVIASPHTRAAATAARAFGAAVDPSLEAATGNLGAAQAGVGLADALDRAQPGEHVLVVSAADGADALVLRVTDAIAGRPATAGPRAQLGLAEEVDYATYLTWRGTLVREPPRRPDPVRPEGPPAQRAASWKFGFVGTRCRSCERVHVPPTRVCGTCGAVDEMDDVSMADRQGTVTTYTVDRLAFSLSPPTITAAIDFEGGGRFTCELTDCTPEDVDVGTRVEMTFRRMYSAAGVHNYFWKGRPVKERS